MVRPKFKAFLSCSFKEQDESLREWFKELIRSFGIDPFVATPQEPRPAQETIMNNIKDSQCFIAILTKNKLLQDSHQWVTSDYIQQEIGMSIATKKPMAIFIEKGVCIPDLLKGVTGYISFDREQIAVDTPKMTCLLLNLITELEQRLGYRPPPKLPYDIGNREFLSFEEFRVGLLYLHDIMEKQGFKPDVIVGMDRGGPTLAGILGKLRGCKVTSILIKDECMLSSTQDSLDPGLKNKDYRILLVDDACRKARAMPAAKTALQKYTKTAEANIKTAVMLYEVPFPGHNKFKPDFYAYETKLTTTILPWDSIEEMKREVGIE